MLVTGWPNRFGVEVSASFRSQMHWCARWYYKEAFQNGIISVIGKHENRFNTVQNNM